MPVQASQTGTPRSVPSSGTAPDRILSRFFWFGAILAAVLLFAHRYTWNADGLSFIELGESWWRGDFADAINGYWNPFYAILAGLAVKLMPSGIPEPVGPHILNFFLFVGMFFSFGHFLRTLSKLLPADDANSRRVLYLVSAPVFLWCALRVNEIVELIADPLVFIFVLLAAARLLTLNQNGWKDGVLLGVFLGLGYLAKSVMFPLGLVFLGVSLFMARPFGRAVGLTTVATLCFVAVASIFIVPLSLQKHRLTSGDSGGLAYAWEVNHYGPYFHWDGRPPGSGTAKHPTHQILEHPPTYEFDSGMPGTYTLFRDPSYWNEGLHPHFSLRDQSARLRKSAKFYRENLVREPILIVLVFSLLIGGTLVGWRAYVKGTAPLLPITAAASVPFFMYAAVYIDARYLAPFLLLIVLTGLTGYLRARDGVSERDLKWARVTSAFVSFMLVCATLMAAGRALQRDRWNSYRTHERVANALVAAGVHRGDKLAVIGKGGEAYFARILGSPIVAESSLFPGQPEWPATAENLNKIAAAVQHSTDAVAIIAMVPPVEGDASEWTAVPETVGSFRLLRGATAKR
jgi:hypothetical protein